MTGNDSVVDIKSGFHHRSPDLAQFVEVLFCLKFS